MSSFLALICFSGVGILTACFLALCRDGKKKRTAVESQAEANPRRGDAQDDVEKWMGPASRVASVGFIVLLAVASSAGQETVFNVPTGDVLDRGKVYTEFDFTYRPDDAFKTFTPRIVVGAGKRLEVGVNANGVVSPGLSSTTITPTIKWKIYDGADNGWAFLVGDNLFIPVQNRSFDAGTWTYAEFVKSLPTKTRVTFGGYYASANVFAAAQRGGGQFAIEQTVNSKFTLAADWFTGKHGAGYLTPGFFLKLTPKVTWYVAYQVGNTGVSNGNHQFLTEIGWNIN